MEHQEVISSETEQPVQVEIVEATEENRNCPQPLQLSCNHVCMFSKKNYDHLASDQQMKSIVKLWGLIGFCTIFMALEVVGGLKANSLAILTDAAHLLSDIGGISISLFAVWASSWPPTPYQPFGYNRLEVIGALVSVQLIWLICGILIYEAINRILHKHAQVDGKLMFALALVGFVFNFSMVMWIGHGHGHGHSHGHVYSHGHCAHDHSHHASTEKGELCSRNEDESANLVSRSPIRTKSPKLNINLQGAYLHVMADMVQSIGVMITGSIIWAKPDWLIADLVCTLIFSVVAFCTTIPMFREIISILMEGTPREIDIARLESGIRSVGGGCDVHGLRVWAITVGKTVLSCHVIAKSGVESNDILLQIKDYCERACNIHHVTVQIEQGVL